MWSEANFLQTAQNAQEKSDNKIKLYLNVKNTAIDLLCSKDKKNYYGWTWWICLMNLIDAFLFQVKNEMKWNRMKFSQSSMKEIKFYKAFHWNLTDG